ncbi:hypothetical protein A2U01_0083524, partial [Trifolium medium]|nr:hypothetical protein [Trifolium medium]
PTQHQSPETEQEKRRHEDSGEGAPPITEPEKTNEANSDETPKENHGGATPTNYGGDAISLETIAPLSSKATS